jgi:DNA-binding LacI/PurR family transcriptional regulator
VGYSQFDVCDSVGWHERWTYQQLTTQLLERGCSTVVYFTPRRFMQNRSFRLRRAGYMDAIQDHGLQPHVVTMEDRPFSGTAESLSAALGNADGTLAGLVVSCDAALPPLFAAMEGHALGSRECLLTASVHCRGNLEEFPDLVDRVSLIAVEPWEEVGAVSGRRLLGRIRGDGSRPNVSLVRPEIDSHL